jgi:Xaa-Pro dipeptidase
MIRARAVLADAELDGCIVLGPDSQFWLSGLESFISGVLPQALVFSKEADEPTLVVWDADVPLARATSWIDDVRGYRFGVDDPAEAFARVLREKTATVGAVGFDGASPAVSHATGTALAAALAPAALVDCTAPFAALRMVKSPRELDCMRRAGWCAEQGLEAARRAARPGVTERQLAAEIEYALRRAGSDYPSIPTELASGERSVFGHGTPTDRSLRPGDVVHVEIGGVDTRYNAVGIQTFYVGGSKPPPAAVRLYETARTCLDAGLAAAHPGVAARDVEAPALEVLRRRGRGDGFMMRFGYGVGVGYPPTWLDALKITRTSMQTLEPGVTFVLHACLLDEETSTGVLVGGTYVLTSDGPEPLAGAGPVELYAAA